MASRNHSGDGAQDPPSRPPLPSPAPPSPPSPDRTPEPMRDPPHPEHPDPVREPPWPEPVRDPHRPEHPDPVREPPSDRPPGAVTSARIEARQRPRLFAVPSVCPVGVGMSVTQHRHHRSVRAGLPHTAPALGDDDQTLAGVGVAYFGSRKPVIHQAVDATPGDVALTAPAQGAVPQPGYFPPECHEARTVIRYTKVTHVAADHSL